MRFRPCIDIHNGQVKQIVGGSLKDEGNQASANFVSEQDAAFYARMYREDGLSGGHIILLNPVGSEYYEKDCEQAILAMREFPMGMQVGGGILDENAKFFLEKGASHVIVTSYVFKDGEIDYVNLKRLLSAVGKERLVLDLSCRKQNGEYYIVTDRWQKFTDVKVTEETLTLLQKYCDEFLIHAVDVEGKAEGIEEELVKILGNIEGFPITYAGGIGNFEDLFLLRRLGRNNLDVTIGSALDVFGGNMEYKKVLEVCK